MSLFRRTPANPVPFRLPPSLSDFTEGGHGGGYGAQPDSLHRPVFKGGNRALSVFKAFHYGERNLVGKTYEAYIPPRGFSEWLR